MKTLQRNLRKLTVPALGSPPVTHLRTRVCEPADGSGVRFPFIALPKAPLIVDAVYSVGTRGNRADDALARLFPRRGLHPGCGNAGGFRPVGGREFGGCSMLVVKSSGSDPEWPDHLDRETGLFTYFGDNKRPGNDLHETSRGGNQLLARIFGASVVLSERAKTPPVFVFIKDDDRGAVRFRGLAVPFAGPDDGLVAIWRQTGGRRFQNYRATFAILNCARVDRPWLDALQDGDATNSTALAPRAWQEWITRGSVDVLRAPRTIQVRTKQEQLPSRTDGRACELAKAIYDAVKDAPHDFEFIATELFRLIEPRVFDIEVTRKSVDGGRDATGRLRIGGVEGQSDPTFSDFALEAKAYSAGHGVGVKDTSRLISRLRHRQFGVLVTTSYVSPQAYKELREDQHPVVIITASDIVTILRGNNISTRKAVNEWVDGVLARGVRR